ncbi:hypothetical protein [Paenibacillus melissococcoides]|nr:hypothetical protein [Paenibacillus melissococcoides]CAH8708607.1 hypothetical protein HTL2_002042 [Paenibacillus melissococcoides]CAH8718629.1 hypothetical protein HTL2_005338 [Paenibacillus melissococcoides]
MSKKQTTVEIQGVEYTFQHPGVRESVRLGTDPKIRVGNSSRKNIIKN